MATPDWSIDRLTGRPVVIVEGRQDRPNHPEQHCPFCPGGLEAPDRYDVRWFPNRWPSLPDERSEVVLYSPDHNASLASIGVDPVARVVGLWGERTVALGARPDVDYVLIFENRGAEVGATIAHPHGQIYAFGFVPDAPLDELLRGGRLGEPGGRLIATAPGWRAWVPGAPACPHEARLR